MRWNSDPKGWSLDVRTAWGSILGGPHAEHPSARRPAARPTWRVERRQLPGTGVLCTPAPALRRLVLIQLRLPARRVLGARHGPSPGPPAALCLRRRRPRNRGEITPPNDRPALGAAAGAGPRRGRASQPIGTRALAAPGQSQASGPQPTAAPGGGVAAGRSWARKGGPVCASPLRPVGSSAAPEPESRSPCSGPRLDFCARREAPAVCTAAAVRAFAGKLLSSAAHPLHARGFISLPGSSEMASLSYIARPSRRT